MTDAANIPAATLDWRAIAAGAGASLAIGFSASFLMRPLYSSGIGYGTIQFLSIMVGLLADTLGGAVAGLLARRRGALHGALAMLLASAFGLVVTFVVVGRQGHFEALANVGFWAQWMLMALLGLGAGTLAGWIAARIAAKSTR
jgi:hypothetical protein